MPASRLLAAFAAGALVTVPGLALAQGGLLTEPESEVATEDETETVTETETVLPTETESETEAQTEAVEDETESEPEELTEDAPLEVQEVEEDDEGHGEVISALAQCMPSGRALHGTGFTKGFVMSQAASTGQVVIEAHGIDVPVASPEDAAALCDLLAPIIDEAEAPDTAKGHPDWAGPKDDAEVAVEAEDVDGEGHGGPPHARERGAKGPKGAR